MDFTSSVLALAEPVPFTVAILTVKSLTRVSGAEGVGDMVMARRSGALGRLRGAVGGLIHRVRPGQLGFLHVPGRGRAALRAQSAVDATGLVPHPHAPRLR